jgi:hypothetical protein
LHQGIAKVLIKPPGGYENCSLCALDNLAAHAFCLDLQSDLFSTSTPSSLPMFKQIEGAVRLTLARSRPG